MTGGGRSARRPRWAVLLLPAIGAACGEADTVAPAETGPASIVVLAGADQRGVPGRPPAEAIAVRVLDAEGRPVSGAAVTFQPGAGHGSTDPTSTTADAGGEATTSWTLGATPGPQHLEVSAGRASATVRAEAVDLEAELDALFAPASATEVEAVRADWARRDIAATGVSV
ncbi:MAG: hypothetical protein F4143_11900 [Gemmatimonadales bacterium]|nr:hypothetical protein [Gemmatimonadales bacterium]